MKDRETDNTPVRKPCYLKSNSTSYTQISATKLPLRKFINFKHLLSISNHKSDLSCSFLGLALSKFDI